MELVPAHRGPGDYSPKNWVGVLNQRFSYPIHDLFMTWQKIWYPVYDLKMAAKWPKSIPCLWPKRLKNHTLWGRAYLDSTYKGGPRARLLSQDFYCIETIVRTPLLNGNWVPVLSVFVLDRADCFLWFPLALLNLDNWPFSRSHNTSRLPPKSFT